MIQYLVDILRAAGVPLLVPDSTIEGTTISAPTTTTNGTKDDDDGYVIDTAGNDSSSKYDEIYEKSILTTMEVWIGLQQAEINGTEENTTILPRTVEDFLPLSNMVMIATIRWLIATWNESDSATTMTTSAQNLNSNSHYLRNQNGSTIHTNLLQI